MSYPTGMFSTVASLYEDYIQSYEPESTRDAGEIKEEIREKMSSEGYTRVRSTGTYRTAWENEDHVVKFASGRLGTDENSSEIRNNTRISNKTVTDITANGTCSGNKFIADIYSYETSTHRWLVMERVTVTPNNVSPETAEDVRDTFRQAGIHIDEIYPENMGRDTNGVPVVFDYAGT